MSLPNGSISRASLIASRISSSHPSGVRMRARFILEPVFSGSFSLPGPQGVLTLPALHEQGSLAVFLDVLVEGDTAPRLARPPQFHFHDLRCQPVAALGL